MLLNARQQKPAPESSPEYSTATVPGTGQNLRTHGERLFLGARPP
jgi:hypothetical protein